MSKDDLVYVRDIYGFILKINKFLESVSLEEFADNAEKQDAVIRNYEVMGICLLLSLNSFLILDTASPITS